MKKNIQLQVVIHLGLPKTGTTFLQKAIFSNFPDINYIERNFNLKTKIQTNKLNLISEEGLSGSYYRTINNEDNRFDIANKLKLLFPNAKILLGIREQNKWIRSMYSQAVREGCPHSFNKWYELINKNFLDVDKYVKYLKNLFSDVYIFNFEELKNNREYTIKNICDFIGLDVPNYENKIYNVRLSNYQIKGKRIVNKFIHSSSYNPKGIVPETIFKKLFNSIRKH
jgi:hypothetical protein